MEASTSWGATTTPKRGDYHYHRGLLAGKTFTSKGEALEALRRVEAGRPSKAKGETQWRVVTRVIDGDTLILEGNEKVRLIGVDTL